MIGRAISNHSHQASSNQVTTCVQLVTLVLLLVLCVANNNSNGVACSRIKNTRTSRSTNENNNNAQTASLKKDNATTTFRSEGKITPNFKAVLDNYETELHSLLTILAANYSATLPLPPRSLSQRINHQSPLQFIRQRLLHLHNNNNNGASTSSNYQDNNGKLCSSSNSVYSVDLVMHRRQHTSRFNTNTNTAATCTHKLSLTIDLCRQPPFFVEAPCVVSSNNNNYNQGASSVKCMQHYTPTLVKVITRATVTPHTNTNNAAGTVGTITKDEQHYSYFYTKSLVHRKTGCTITTSTYSNSNKVSS